MSQSRISSCPTVSSLLTQIKEIQKMAASSNVLIAKLQTDLSNAQQQVNQTDTNTQAFLGNLQTFFTSLQTSGTVLSAADQAALTALDTEAASISSGSSSTNAAVSAITIPSVP